MQHTYSPKVQELLDQLSPEQYRAQVKMIKCVRAAGIIVGLSLAIASVLICIMLFHPYHTIIRDAVATIADDIGGPMAHAVLIGGSLTMLSAGVQAVIASSN